MEGTSLQERIVTLRGSKSRDWGTKVQQLCEEAWMQIDRLSDSDIAAFTHFLKERQDVYQLAELIIPELRADALPLSGPPGLLDRRSQVLTLTEDRRNTTQAVTSATQTSFDSPLYRAEKDRFQDAQIHRARLLLQHSGKLGAKSQLEILEWLDKAPKEEEEEEEEEAMAAYSKP